MFPTPDDIASASGHFDDAVALFSSLPIAAEGRSASFEHIRVLSALYKQGAAGPLEIGPTDSDRADCLQVQAERALLASLRGMPRDEARARFVTLLAVLIMVEHEQDDWTCRDAGDFAGNSSLESEQDCGSSASPTSSASGLPPPESAFLRSVLGSPDAPLPRMWALGRDFAAAVAAASAFLPHESAEAQLWAAALSRQALFGDCPSAPPPERVRARRTSLTALRVEGGGGAAAAPLRARCSSFSSFAAATAADAADAVAEGSAEPALFQRPILARRCSVGNLLCRSPSQLLLSLLGSSPDLTAVAGSPEGCSEDSPKGSPSGSQDQPLSPGCSATGLAADEWEAWAALKGLPQDEALARYAEAVYSAAAGTFAPPQGASSRRSSIGATPAPCMRPHSVCPQAATAGADGRQTLLRAH